MKTNWISKRFNTGLLALTVLLGVIFGVLSAAGISYAFTTQWSTHFNEGNFGNWDTYKIGACGGQNHSVSGSQAHMSASYGTECFGAYYRDNNKKPGTFPTDKDVRVMWQWKYDDFELYGTQAGQVTSAYGVVQYYGMSAVNTADTGGDTKDWHVLADGDFGHWDVDTPMKLGTDHNWHTSTFDFICDGREMYWWVDATQIHAVTNGTVRPPNDPYRPYQFWFGNLLTDTPSDGAWTNQHMEFVYIYGVERPQMNTPSAGSGGSQPVSWTAVPNTQQPDGATWGIKYQTQVCSDSNCSNVIATADWQDGLTYTFTGLPLQQTYYYRVRARWEGTPPLTTCWSAAVPAQMTGEPNVAITKNAPAQVEAGATIQYTLIVQSTGEVPANGVVVRDPVPQYVLNPTNISNSGQLQGTEIVWNLGTIPNGESRTLTWQGTVDPNIPVSVTQITNVGTVSDDAGHTGQDDATTAVLKPIMELSKTTTPQVWPSATINYTITVRSVGNSALRNVVVRDPLPTHVTNPVNISNGGTLQGNEIVWSLGDMAPGVTIQLTWQGTVSASIPRTQTQILNHVTATATGITEEAEAVSEVLFPIIDVSKTGPIEAAPEEQVSYAIAVSNIGNGPAVNVIVRDPVPQYILNPTNISNNGQLENNEIVWNISQIDPGANVILTWEGTLDPDIPITVNQIINTVTACDSTGSCDSALVSTRVLKPAVKLVKNATSHVYPHGEVDYEIIVENVGETKLKQITVIDPLPQYVLNPRDINYDGMADNSPFEGRIQIVWYLKDMLPGEAAVLTWKGTVDPSTPDEEFAIRNVATVAATNVTAQAEATSYVLHPRILLRKSATVMASPGDTILYTLTVENHSWAPAYGVEVHDPIPEYIINQRNATEGGEVRAEEILWRFGIMNPGESRTLMWEGTVDLQIPATVPVITNTARAFDGMGHEDEAEAFTNMPAQVLYAYKTSSYIVWPGGEIEYALTLQNFDQATLEQVVVRDPVPDHVTYPRDISHGGVFEGNTEVVWHVPGIAPGETVVLTWKGTVDPALPREIDVLWNEANITTAGGLTATVKTKSYVDFPMLNIYKAATAQAGPGEVISYTVLIENPANVPALNVVVRDPIPASVVNPINISDGGIIESVPAYEIVWNIESLNGGERRFLTWEGVVDLNVPASRSQISNTVRARDLTGLTVQAQANTSVLRPGLSMTKVAPVEIAPTQTVDYVLNVANTGQMKLRDVIVVDPVPQYILNPVNISASGVLSGTEAVWYLGEMVPGESVTLSWQGTLDQAIPVGIEEVTNHALAGAWPGVQALATATSKVTQPNLHFVKQATEGVMPGDVIDYKIDLVNQGTIPVYQIEVTDPITSYIAPYRIGEGGYEMPGGYVTWGNLGDLMPGESRTLTWQARVDPKLPREIKEIRNVAQLRAGGGLYLEAVAVGPVLESGLTLTKEATEAVHAGGEVNYVLHLVNKGPGLERQIVVRDPVPGPVEYIPDSVNAYGQLEDRTLVWSVEELQPGESIDLTWRGQVDADIPLAVNKVVNEAYASSFDTPDTITATAATRILEPEVVINHNCPPSGQVGKVWPYQVRIENIGEGPLRNVLVKDVLPMGTTYVPESATNGGYLNGSELIWDVGTMAPGAVVDLAFSLKGPNSQVIGDVVVNKLRLYSGETIYTQSNCETQLDTPVLSLTKVGPERAKVNDIIEYTITVTNTGQVIAYNSILSDTLLPGVDYVPGSASDAAQIGDTTLVWQLGDLLVGESVTRKFRAQVYVPIGFNGYDENGDARILNEAFASADGASPVRGEAVVLVPRPVLTLTRTSLVQTKIGSMVAYTAVDDQPGGPQVTLAKIELRSSSDVAALTTGQLSASAVQQTSTSVLVVPGDTVTYTLYGGNAGPGVARQAMLRERVPTGLIVLENTISHNGYYEDEENRIVWALGDLEEGQQVIRTYVAMVPLGMRPGMYQLENNLAYISSPDAPTVYANASTEITGTFKMSGAKTASTYAAPGSTVDYRIQVQNISPNMVDHVVIRDPLPQYATYVENSASIPPAFESGGQTLVWNLGAMSANEIREVRFRVRLANQIPNVYTRLVNKAQISFTGGEAFEVQATTMLPGGQITPTATPKPSGGSSSSSGSTSSPTSTPVPGRPPVVYVPPAATPVPPTQTPGPTPLPEPGLVKSVSPATVKEGQTTAVVWRLSFTNPTPLTIAGLVVRDVLPEGVDYVSGSTTQGTIQVNQIPLTGGAPIQVISTTGISQTSTVQVQSTAVVQVQAPSATVPAQTSASLSQMLNAMTQSTSQPTPAPTPTQVLSSTETVGSVQQVVSTTQVTTSTIQETVQQQAAPAAPPPWTEVVVDLGDIPPGGRAEVIIHTLVVSPTRGTVYDNIATYSAKNMDPGSSNEATVTVEYAPVILPVTGGLLDPRTPQGKVTWSLILMVIANLAWWGRQRRLRYLERLNDVTVPVEVSPTSSRALPGDKE